MLVELKQKSQVTIPSEMVKKLKLKQGRYFAEKHRGARPNFERPLRSSFQIKFNIRLSNPILIFL